MIKKIYKDTKEQIKWLRQHGLYPGQVYPQDCVPQQYAKYRPGGKPFGIRGNEK